MLCLLACTRPTLCKQSCIIEYSYYCGCPGSHVTRFIALGDVANTGKQKWLHALKLMPAGLMAAENLNARPADTTECPYQSKKRAREADEGAEATQVRFC